MKLDRWRLRVDDNVCCSILQIGILVFSLFFRYGEISFSVCRRHSLLSAMALASGVRWFLWSEDVDPKALDLSSFY